MMKTYKINIIPLAKHQLLSIADYITAAYCSPHTAKTIINELFDTVSSLGTMPYRYKVINTIINTKYKIRKTRCKNYYVYYFVDENKLCVYVIGIIYAKANQDNALHVIVKSI